MNVYYLERQKGKDRSLDNKSSGKQEKTREQKEVLGSTEKRRISIGSKFEKGNRES